MPQFKCEVKCHECKKIIKNYFNRLLSDYYIRDNKGNFYCGDCSWKYFNPKICQYDFSKKESI